MAREDRATEVRRERRMKPGAVALSGIKLHLDRDKVPADIHPRWVADRPGRVAQLIAQDYDIITTRPTEGSTQSVHGGTEDSGKPYGMILMGKYNDWYEDDQRRRMDPLERRDDAIRRGVDHHVSLASEPDPNGPYAASKRLFGAGVYSPVENKV